MPYITASSGLHFSPAAVSTKYGIIGTMCLRCPVATIGESWKGRKKWPKSSSKIVLPTKCDICFQNKIVMRHEPPNRCQMAHSVPGHAIGARHKQLALQYPAK